MRKPLLFYELFIPIFLIGISIIVGFCIYIYHSSYQTVEKSILEEKQSYTEQIHYNIEQKVRTIEYGYSLYSSTSNFKDTFTRSLSEKDFNIYKDINKQISYVEMIGIEGSKYSLISLSQNWGIIQGTLKHLSADEINNYKSSYIADSKNSLFWVPADNGIEMIMTLPIYEQEKFALLISDIPRRSIDKIVNTGKNNSIAIYNNQDKLLYRNKEMKGEFNSEVLSKIKNKAKNNMEKPMIFDTGNGEKYVYLMSNYNHWIYIVEVKKDEIAALVKNTKLGIIFTSVLLIIVVGSISYRISESFSTPIKRIIDKLNDHGIKNKRRGLTNLTESIDQIVGQNVSLKTTLSQQKPLIETLFVLNLFRNHITQNEINHRLEQFGYYFNEEYIFYIGLVQMDKCNGQKINDVHLLLMAINNIIMDIIPTNRRLIPIVLNEEMQATVFSFKKDNLHVENDLINYYELIQEKVKNLLNVTISVGISPVYNSLMESKNAVDLANEALHFRVNTGPESIIFYKDIAPILNHSSISKLPIDLLNELLNAIRSRNKEEAIQIVDILIDNIYKLNNNPISLEITLIKLITELIQLGQLLGTEPMIFINSKKIYQVAMDGNYPEKIKQTLITQLILPIIESTDDKTERDFKSIADRIIYIIQQEFDQDISLEIIAERLHYNPKHLSRIFKREYGENFADYLINYRLEKAKTWLKETDMTIKEIAERLQYNNPQNFIRFFKKKLGITPGEFRKSFRY
ncbi:AraC family transcriptional regulator [Caldifermentibacillus hisashii]|uniref:helix-turn-helix domain-containing protein n=1 Tax=Caldifermentibacillus hisashii TaxID=996558 RepID=UPI0031FCF2A1